MIEEINLIKPLIFVALGRIAFDSILQILTGTPSRLEFHHHALYQIDQGTWVLASYHPSRQNTQTGRLTVEMFNQVWKTVKRVLKEEFSTR